MELTYVVSRAHASRSHLVLGWSQALWAVFRPSPLGDEDRREDLYLGLFILELRSCVKIVSFDMLKYIYTNSKVLVFCLIVLDFQEYIF